MGPTVFLPSAVLMQEVDPAAGAVAAFMALFGGIWCILWLVAMALMIAGMWKMFEKAGQPGWASLVPIYNVMVLLQIVGRPSSWIILFLIPIANIFVAVMLMLDLAKAFGKGSGFAVGLILFSPIFMAILGFGDAVYRGPVATPG